MSNIKLSVIIVSYINIKFISDCIESIFKYNDVGDAVEVIVVDNSPDNKLYNYVKNQFTEVKVIKNINNGFGAGNNVGVKYSKGEYLLFLNPDTILVESVFKFAIKKFENDAKLAIFGLALIKEDLSPSYSFFVMDKIGTMANLINKICKKFNLFLPKHMFINGADMFIRKDIFLQAGQFDENIFMYEEESDLTHRVYSLNNKYKIKFFKNKKIIHLEGGSSPGIEGQCNSINRLLVTEKYYCKKYNINYEKRLKKRLSYEKFKLHLYKIMKSIGYKDQKKICQIYEDNLKNNQGVGEK